MMAEPPPPEFTVIFIDNGRRACVCEGVYRAQLEATKLYCKTVLQCNPKNIVNIFTMSSSRFGTLVHPTSDLKEIMSELRYVPCDIEGETEFQRALARALGAFSEAPSDMKKRLLMFVGSTVHLHLSEARSYGKMLKESAVALDVFNFFQLEIDASFDKEAKISVLEGHYHYGRTELEILVTEVNDHGNSHIEDITDEYESFALDTLSETTLKEHLHYLDQKAAADDEKNKSAADEKNKCVEAWELEQFNEKKKCAAVDEYGKCFHGEKKRNIKNKDIVGEYESSVLGTLSKSGLKKYLHYLKKAADEKNTSVEALESERFNEKNESTADDEYGKCFSRKKKRNQTNIVGEYESSVLGTLKKAADKGVADEKNKSVEALELERFIEKNKSAADDGYGKRFSGKQKRKQKRKQKKKKN